MLYARLDSYTTKIMHDSPAQRNHATRETPCRRPSPIPCRVQLEWPTKTLAGHTLSRALGANAGWGRSPRPLERSEGRWQLQPSTNLLLADRRLESVVLHTIIVCARTKCGNWPPTGLLPSSAFKHRRLNYRQTRAHRGPVPATQRTSQSTAPQYRSCRIDHFSSTAAS